MTISRHCTSLVALLAIVSLLGCTKELVFGKDHESSPVRKFFNQGIPDLFTAAKQTLKEMGYKLDYEDREKGYLKTGWVAATADSHYLEIFDREDYGTFSAYYQLEIRMKPSGNETEVEVAAPARAIVRHIKSSYRVEKKFLSKLHNQVRGADLHMSNVGVKDK